MDQFSEVPSTVSVTNVITGFAGTGAVARLDISMTEQHEVELTLGGDQDGTYLLEASTDFATWDPIATVTLAVGTPITVFDADPTGLQGGFNRAVAP